MAYLSGMGDPQHRKILTQGGKVWNAWRRAQPTVVPNLSSAKLSGASLSGANLAGANLSGANLNGADLRGAELQGADLRGTHLSGANICKTNLSGINLSGADLSRADLHEAHLTNMDLSKANLSGANLRGANLGGTKFIRAILNGADLTLCSYGETIFGDTALNGAIGLEKGRHQGPSFVDHLTLLRSGLLPLPFLRGCGLPDILINYLPSLLHAPIQFYSCFISYSTKDQEFADRLHADLQNKGVRCWFALHDIQAGKKIHEQIDQAIHLYDRLLLILSPASMESEWVKTEIAKARKREMKEKRRVLFPVRLVEFESLRDWTCFDADTGKDSAREIREYYVPDFSKWKDHNAYQKEFEKLVRDLEAGKHTAT
jgi:TIR domain/Pentapeptide repeats (8 copies)